MSDELKDQEIPEIDEDLWTEDLAFTKSTIRGELANILFNDRDLYYLIQNQNSPRKLLYLIEK